jgi:hypothetical protein
VANSPAFDVVCDHIERATSLDRLQARGTVRLALKDAGLDAAAVSPAQMQVVVQKLLPKELVARGVKDADAVLAPLREALAALVPGGSAETPEAIFQRLAGAA